MEDMRTAVVTGGSSGIGLTISTDLLAEGWSVISVQRGVPDVESDRLTAVSADLSTSDGIAASLREIHALTRHVDLLVNNAGAIFEVEDLMEVTEQTMSSSWHLHTLSPLMLTRGLIDLLEATPSPAVVNIGSVYGTVIDPEVIAYGSAKHGLGYVSAALAKALAPRIRVNALNPGHVDTSMTRSAPPEFIESVVAKTPLKRIADAAEISRVVRFLASSDASFITGANLTVDGGFMAAR
ncbi:MAG TPA: SDR family oxidoreductase [Streptosporangiaceae bacterium]